MVTSRLIAVLAAAVLIPAVAQAHITLSPTRSNAGARERYTIRAPNERRVSTVKIEGQFPAAAKVTALQQAPGWVVDIKHDAKGAIVGATWTGDLPPDQFAEFGLQVVNPTTAGALTWTFTQTYANGEVVGWTGPVGSRTPAPQVEIVAAPAAGAKPAMDMPGMDMSGH